MNASEPPAGAGSSFNSSSATWSSRASPATGERPGIHGVVIWKIVKNCEKMVTRSAKKRWNMWNNGEQKWDLIGIWWRCQWVSMGFNGDLLGIWWWFNGISWWRTLQQLPKEMPKLVKSKEILCFFKHFWHLYGVYSNYVELL